MIRFIELFAGIGGFRYGLENCREYIPKERGNGKYLSSKRDKPINNRLSQGRYDKDFRCVWANEWDYNPYKKEKQYAWKIYKKHYGEIDTRNIEDIPTKFIPNHEMLTAGFPCQSFSIAGKRKGMSGEDTRGSLFYEIYRIAKERQPRLLLLENVPGLFSSRGGEDFCTILKSLDEIGYDVEWDCINTSIFLPQNRERVFIVGHLRGKSRQKVFPIGEDDCIYKGQSQKRVENLHSRTLRSSYYKIHTDETLIAEDIISVKIPTNTKLGYDIAEERKDGIRLQYGNSKTARGRVIKGRSQALQGSGQVGILDNAQIRRLTPTECERLQGFPDGWTEGISDTQRYKCLGNAVTTNVIEEIGKKILEVL